MEEPQVREEVDDLLLAEVAAAGGTVGRQVEGTELLLEPLGVGARGEEEDDLPGRRDAGVDELADATGDVTGLGAAPVDAGLGGRGLVRDEELHGVPERRLVGRRRRLEALELVPELGREELVHGREHLGARAVVPGQREDGRRCLAPLAEHRHVGVTEPVDRLELVADDEEVAALDRLEQVEKLGLQAVRVLELVDHDRAEPLPLALPDLRVVPEEVAGAELEVLEVERGLAVLRVRVGGREGREQLLQKLAVPGGELLERRRDDRVARLREARRARASHLELAEGEEPLGERRRAEQVERRLGRVTLQLGRLGVGDEAVGRLADAVHALAEAGAGTRLEDEISTCRAERRVDLDEHAAEAVGAVGGEELPAVGLVGGAERLERGRERLGLEDERLRLVEHAEARIDPGREGMRAEEPPAEAVDRRDPGAVELEREVGPPPLDEARPDARAKLSGRPLRVGDDEDGVDVEAVVDDGADEPLDEHRGLPGARAGGDEHGAACLGRCALLLVRRRPHGRSLRHMRQRSHQCGQSPPFGSWRTSPSRIRSTSPTAVERAVSIASANSSGSR